MPKGGILAFDELDNPQWPGETKAVMDKVGLRRSAARATVVGPIHLLRRPVEGSACACRTVAHQVSHSDSDLPGRSEPMSFRVRFVNPERAYLLLKPELDAAYFDVMSNGDLIDRRPPRRV